MSVNDDGASRGGSTTASSAPADDPLASLYRMSTTAGAGSQEYIAINPLAVTSVVLGLASVLVLMGWPLLVVPIAAIIFAIAAMRQISRSNGTQSGNWLAVGGIVLGIGFALLVGGRQVMARMEAAQEQQQINALAAELSEDLVAQRWADAYTLFSPEFQETWPAGEFADRLQQVLVHQRTGALKNVASSRRVDIRTGAGEAFARGLLYFDFENLDEPFKQDVQYEKHDGAWRVSSIPTIFPVATSESDDPHAGHGH